VLEAEGIHPTYVDHDIILSRLNQLLYSDEQFKWISSRPWLYNPVIEKRYHFQYRESGLVSTSKYIEASGYELVNKFGYSIKSIFTEGGSPLPKSELLHNPLAISVRMIADLQVKLDDDVARSIQFFATQAKLMKAGGAHSTALVDPLLDNSGYGWKEEWKVRVANYLTHCVEGGLYSLSTLGNPGQGYTLTLQQLADGQLVLYEKVVALQAKFATMDDSEDDKKLIPGEIKMFQEKVEYIDKLVDYFINMKQCVVVEDGDDPKTGHVQVDGFENIGERVVKTNILKAFSCNELALLRFVQAKYFEGLETRLGTFCMLFRRYRVVHYLCPLLYFVLLFIFMYDLLWKNEISL
jgi:hypothetical protein